MHSVMAAYMNELLSMRERRVRAKDRVRRLLVAYTRANLATYKCPSRIIFADSLPRNASGKLLKHEMRKIYGGAA